MAIYPPARSSLASHIAEYEPKPSLCIYGSGYGDSHQFSLDGSLQRDILLVFPHLQ